MYHSDAWADTLLVKAFDLGIKAQRVPGLMVRLSHDQGGLFRIEFKRAPVSDWITYAEAVAVLEHIT